MHIGQTLDLVSCYDSLRNPLISCCLAEAGAGADA